MNTTTGILINGQLGDPCDSGVSSETKHRTDVEICSECGIPFLTVWRAHNDVPINCNHTIHQCIQCHSAFTRTYTIRVGRHKTAHATLGTICTSPLPLAFGGIGPCRQPELLARRMRGA